jgi:hypothetical protein
MGKPTATLRCLTLAAASLNLVACGGGSGDSANDGEVFGLTSTSVTTRALSPAQKQGLPEAVQLEGCVVDSQWLSAAGVAVHVALADGRAVGTAFTDARGVFALKVPARSALVVSTDWAAPAALMLNSGSQAMSVAACLPAAT